MNLIKFLTIVFCFFILQANIFSQNIVIHNPIGGEQYQIGSQQIISWTHKNVERIDISFSADEGETWNIIHQNIRAEMGMNYWKVPESKTGKIKIKIQSVNKLSKAVSKYVYVLKEKFSIKGNLNKKSLNVNGTSVILPLGNSITFDNRASDTRPIGDKIGYRFPLYNLLKNAGYDFSFTGSEDAGGNFLPFGYTKNAGFPGISDDQLLTLLKSGRQIQPYHGIDRQVTAGPYLNSYPADIILLHIGTNGNDKSDGTSPEDIEGILDEIKRYEDSTNTNIKVILARIIDRVPNQSYVHTLNDNVQVMVLDRVNNPLNDAYPDDIIMVDMEDGAGLNYSISPDPNGSPGDMNDIYHPNDKGYAKMAQVWFNALKTVLPGGVPSIIEQPSNAYIFENTSTSFSITAQSVSSISYQWIRNGVNISGATNSILNLTNVNSSYDSSKIWCKVYNPNGIVYSDTAYLFVTKMNERVSHNLIAVYNFNEANGNIVNDNSNLTPLLPLSIEETSSFTWLPIGLDLYNSSLMSTAVEPSKLYNNVLRTNEFTIELWLQPKLSYQIGPATILSLSHDLSNRNITIGQNADKFSLRLRTTSTDQNGLPEIVTNSGVVKNDITHLVVTRNAEGNIKIFVNGLIQNNELLSGELSNWNTTYDLLLGNEANNSTTFLSWLGTYYLVAFYDKVLSTTEINHNYNIGFLNKNKIVLTPSDLRGQIENESEVLLNWTDNSNNEDGFSIERKANHPDSSYHLLSTISSANVTEFLDNKSKYVTSYLYRVIAFNNNYVSPFSNIITIDNLQTDIEDNGIPKKFYLSQNYPNPFNPSTIIKFGLPSQSLVSLKIYDSLGKEVAELIDSKVFKQGNYSQEFSLIKTNNLSSGIYYYVLKVKDIESNNFYSKTKKMILLK